MVALGQAWPLRPGYLFHCRQSYGHQLRLGCWARSMVLGWQAPRAVAIPTTRAVLPITPPPREGWEFCHKNFSLPWYWTQGLGRGFPVCDMGPSSA